MQVTYFEFSNRDVEMAKANRDGQFRGAEPGIADDAAPELRDILRGGVLIVKASRVPSRTVIQL